MSAMQISNRPSRQTHQKTAAVMRNDHRFKYFYKEEHFTSAEGCEPRVCAHTKARSKQPREAPDTKGPVPHSGQSSASSS